MRRSNSRSEGIILIVVIATLSVLLTLVITLGGLGARNASQVLHLKQAAASYYAAQAGLARAIYAVKTDYPAFPPCGNSAPTPAYLSNQPLSFDRGYFTATVSNNYRGSYGVGCGALTAPDGTPVPQGAIYLSGCGGAQPLPGGCAAGTVVKNFRIMLQPVWTFPYATFSVQNFGATATFAGTSFTDSYDSRLGAYGGSNVSRNGNIGTNAIAANTVTIRNTGSIDGRVDVGPGGSAGAPTIRLLNSGRYDSAAVLSSALTAPAVVDPLGGPGAANITVNVGTTPLAPGLYRNVTVQNTGTLQLSCGVYSVNNFLVQNTALVQVNAGCNGQNPAILYFHGTLRLIGAAGSTVNSGMRPAGLLFYGAGAGAVTISEQASLAVYAPSSTITLNPGAALDVYGSLVGLTVNVTNAAVHFDWGLNLVNTRGWSAQY